jgi:hypothetical protein
MSKYPQRDGSRLTTYLYGAPVAYTKRIFVDLPALDRAFGVAEIHDGFHMIIESNFMPFGRSQTEETRELIRQKALGRPGLKGNKNPAKRPEVRKKMSEAAKGKKLSPETRAKMSAVRKGRKMKPETIEHMKAAAKRREQAKREAKNVH